MNAFNLLIEQANSRSVVTISLPNGEGKRDSVIKGLLTQDISFGGGVNYTSPFETQATENIASLVNNINAIISANQIGGQTTPLIPVPKFYAQTMAVWSGCEPFSFTVPLTLVALKETDNILDAVMQLNRAVHPTQSTLFAEKFAQKSIMPPLNYTPAPMEEGKPAANTVSVSIGGWFRAHSLLITNVNFTVSKETIKSGLPLMATGDVTFRTYRVVSYEEFKSFFRG